MMEASKFRKYSLLGQIGVWSLLFMIYFIEMMDYEGLCYSLFYGITQIVLLAIPAYTHYYALLPLFNKGHKILYFSLTFLLITLSSLINCSILYYFEFDDLEVRYFWADFIYYFILTAIILVVLSLQYFVRAWYLNIQTESMLRSEKLQAELNFLKSQINPHFLFNTLNNIYSYAQTSNPKTAPMLERLSSILRFMVYDCSEDIVELSKEVTAVENLLEIQRMKNSEQRNISFSTKGIKGFHLIAPLIIVNFVENACKHSDVGSNPEGFIRVHIAVDEKDHCLVDISNSTRKKSNLPGKYQGLGMENIRKRLDLQYKDNYQMAIQKGELKYQLTLRMPLTRKR